MSRLVHHERLSSAETLPDYVSIGNLVKPGGGFGDVQVGSTSVFLPVASSNAYFALSLPLPFPGRLREGALLPNLQPRKRGKTFCWKGEIGMVATVLWPAEEKS
jgi:hypothetical protein